MKRLWRLLSAMPTPEQRATLDAMLLVPEGSRRSNLDRLRRSPTTISARALRQALERLSEIEKLGMSDLDFSRIPPGRVDALARQANAARAQAIARMPDGRRIATLVAFVSRLERTADRWWQNAAVRIEVAGGRAELVLTGLDGLEDPPSLVELRTLTERMLPQVDLPELLLEVTAWTGFADAFTHVSETRSRIPDLLGQGDPRPRPHAVLAYQSPRGIRAAEQSCTESHQPQTHPKSLG